MPPIRKALTSICIVVPLIYIYWFKVVALPDGGPHFSKSSRGHDLNNTLGFSRIFVINLPSRVDRRNTIALAGAVSNLSITFLDGLTGDQVPGNVVSPDTQSLALQDSGARGSWRSHMNAIQAVVDQGLGSALIMEDDVDWDVRLKKQLLTFADASRLWLKESRRDDGRVGLLPFMPPSFVGKRDDEAIEDEGAQKTTISLSSGVDIPNGMSSVYGDEWDVIWLGHCGSDLPGLQSTVSPLRVTVPDDITVPAPKHLKPHPFAYKDKLGELYPPHTRVVHAANGNTCSLAYAVSQQGARKMLWQFGENFVYQFDMMLRDWCQGEYPSTSDKIQPRRYSGKSREDTHNANDKFETVRNQVENPVCVTVQPPLISHHFSETSKSDIQAQGGGYAKGKGTPYIRLGVRENLERLVKGLGETEMVDQLLDDGPTIW
ncbi:glycosyltransferase family 25 protein [Xylariaceae sp. FL0016]|nr:glycosyltransferase family 25 protein [Xylariaceae sp. FL0016]